MSDVTTVHKLAKRRSELVDGAHHDASDAYCNALPVMLAIQAGDIDVRSCTPSRVPISRTDRKSKF